MENTTFLQMLFEIIIFVPGILFLFVLFIKYGGNKLQRLQNGKYIKIMERVGLSKENGLMVVKIGDKGYVLSSASGKVEILLQISDEDMEKIENNNQLPQYDSLKAIADKLKEFKQNIKKEDWNAKKT